MTHGLTPTLPNEWRLWHYSDVKTGAIASQITSLTIVYSIVYSGADQRKHQSSPSLAFVWGIHRRPGNSPHKWAVTRKKFPIDDVIMAVAVHFHRHFSQHHLVLPHALQILGHLGLCPRIILFYEYDYGRLLATRGSNSKTLWKIIAKVVHIHNLNLACLSTVQLNTCTIPCLINMDKIFGKRILIPM